MPPFLLLWDGKDSSSSRRLSERMSTLSEPLPEFSALIRCCSCCSSANAVVTLIGGRGVSPRAGLLPCTLIPLLPHVYSEHQETQSPTNTSRCSRVDLAHHSSAAAVRGEKWTKAFLRLVPFSLVLITSAKATSFQNSSPGSYGVCQQCIQA